MRKTPICLWIIITIFFPSTLRADTASEPKSSVAIGFRGILRWKTSELNDYGSFGRDGWRLSWLKPTVKGKGEWEFSVVHQGESVENQWREQDWNVIAIDYWGVFLDHPLVNFRLEERSQLTDLAVRYLWDVPRLGDKNVKIQLVTGLGFLVLQQERLLKVKYPYSEDMVIMLNQDFRDSAEYRIAIVPALTLGAGFRGEIRPLSDSNKLLGFLKMSVERVMAGLPEGHLWSVGPHDQARDFGHFAINLQLAVPF